jgi:hypothetical protein
MGQSVQIVEKRELRPGMWRLAVDRSLTSTFHENFNDPSAISGHVASTPAGMLAARLFQTGVVQSVHVFSNAVTVELTETSPGVGMQAVEEEVRNLFIHYHPGVKPAAVS